MWQKKTTREVALETYYNEKQFPPTWQSTAGEGEEYHRTADEHIRAVLNVSGGRWTEVDNVEQWRDFWKPRGLKHIGPILRTEFEKLHFFFTMVRMESNDCFYWEPRLLLTWNSTLRTITSLASLGYTLSGDRKPSCRENAPPLSVPKPMSFPARLTPAERHANSVNNHHERERKERALRYREDAR